MAAAVDLAAYRDVLIILGTTAITVPILRRFGISPVLGFLGIGTLLGPSALGRLAEAVPWLRSVTVQDSTQISAFAELGVVFLLFLIGLELSYERLTRMKKLVLIAAVAAVAIVVWKKVADDREERELWAEVTDPVD